MSLLRDDVVIRVRESWDTLRRVPAHGVPGFRSQWPPVVMDYFESYGLHAPTIRLSPAAPVAIDRMNETFTWFVWLNDQPKLTRVLWMTCGMGMGPHRAGCILGYHRNTIRNWREDALALIVDGLRREELTSVRFVQQSALSPINLGRLHAGFGNARARGR